MGAAVSRYTCSRLAPCLTVEVSGSTAVFYTRPGVAYSHVSDIPPNQVCLAWDATRRSPLIQDFAALAADYPPVASQAGPDCGAPSRQPTPAPIPAQADSRKVQQAG